MQNGCATVDTQADYERAASLIGAATGSDSVYRPDDHERVEATIHTFLKDGLTVEEAVQVCLLNNPELQSSFHRLGMARADVVQSQLLHNPSIGIATRFPAGGGLVNLEASMSQNLVDLWQLPIRKQVAERTLNQVLLSIAHLAAQLVSDTKRAYYSTLAADELYQITKQNHKSAERLVQLTKSLQKAGAGSGVDVNLSMIALQEVELLVRQADLEAFQAGIKLIKTLGLIMPPSELVLVDDPPSLPHQTLAVVPILVLAVEQRFDVASAREALLTLAGKIQLEQQRVFSRVELGVEFERESRPRSSDGRFLGQSLLASLAAGAPTLSPDFGTRDDGSEVVVGPTLSIELPLFDQNQAQIAKAKFTYEKARKLLKNLIVEVTHDVRLAHAQAQSAWDTVRFYQQDLLPLREANLTLAQEAYRAGKVSFLTVLEAQRSWQEAKAGSVRALQSSALGWVELERVIALPRKSIEERLIPAESSIDNNTTESDQKT